MSREPTRHQPSSRLSYQQHTPVFLRRLQKNYGRRRRGDDDDEEDEPTYGDGEFEDDGSGWPPDLGAYATQGLSPLPEPSNTPNADAVTAVTKPKAKNSKSLDFSSTGSNTTGTAAKKKRKAVGNLQLQDEDFASFGDMIKDKSSNLTPAIAVE